MSESPGSDEQYLSEWQNSSRLLFYSVVVISFIALPILFLSFLYVKCYRKSHFLPYLCSILIANFILLSTLLISVITENTDMIYDTIPGFLVCKVTAFLVNSSSCFIHWAWVAMYAERFVYIFFPFRINIPNPQRSKIMLLIILIISMIIQVWTPIFITGRRVDNQFDNIYCGEDPEYSNDFQSKFIMVLECLGTFFIPLILTITADISVLMWNNSCSKDIQLVANDEIRRGESRKSSHWKIVSSNSLKNSKKRRTIAIRRCLVSATVTLFLNLPNYSLQLLDEFFNLKDSPNIEARRIFLRIDALVYILYLMQFPITPIHIFFLSRTANRRNSNVEQQFCAFLNQANYEPAKYQKEENFIIRMTMYMNNYGNSQFMTYYNAVDNFGSLESKNVFSPLASERMRRRPSQFDRAVHKAYAEPPQLFHSTSFLNNLYQRIYWSIRSVQFKIFYKNEDMDLDEAVDKWEIGVQPPSLDQLAQKTQFSPKWIKYMYARFKNESPTGKMKEEEFRNLLASIIAPEKATDQYISRLFAAFAGRDKKTITFEDLMDSLSHVHPQTAETNAKWTMRLITGGEGDCFGYSAFLDFTQSVFQLNEGKCGAEELNKESVQQRATTIFTELDSDKDGLVTYEDMIRFFQKNNESSLGFTPVSPLPNGFGNK